MEINKKKINPFVIVLVLVLLCGIGVLEYLFFIKPLTKGNSNQRIIGRIDSKPTNNETDLEEKNDTTVDEIKTTSSESKFNIIDVVYDEKNATEIIPTDMSTGDYKGKISGIDVNKLVDKYYGGYNGKIDLSYVLYLGLNDSVKGGMAFYNTDSSKIGKFDSSSIELSNRDKNGCSTDPFDWKKTEVSYTDLNNSYKELFGDEFNASKTERLLAGQGFAYFNETDSYIEGAICAGGTPISFYYVSEYTLNGNGLVVKINLIGTSRCDTFIDRDRSNYVECFDNVKSERIDVDKMISGYSIINGNDIYLLPDINWYYPSYSKEYYIKYIKHMASSFKDMFTKQYELVFKNVDGKYILTDSKEI